MIKVEKVLPVNITGTELFYKYKNIRMYRLIKDNDHMLTYKIMILFLDESRLSGKLLPMVDIRSFSSWDDTVNSLKLFREYKRIIPQMFRKAIKNKEINDDLYVTWDYEMDEYLVEEL